MTQNETLLAAFRRGESVTTLEATLRFGICRLSERIREIERMGHDIAHEPERANGRRVVRYFLKVGVAA